MALFFTESFARAALYGRLWRTNTAVTTMAKNITVGISAAKSFDESTKSMKENFTELTSMLSCRRPGLRILYFVHTAPKNVKNRTWLRKTIGDSQIAASINSAIVFFVGMASDPHEHRLVEEEAAREGDIVILNFTESYRNLSLKFLFGAKWVLENCNLNSNTTVVKMDDDILVNAFALSSYVDSPAMRHNGIHCYLFTTLGPQRTRKSKWYVTKEEYAPDKYPTYCSGSAYVMRPAVLSVLYKASTHVPIFWVDDVYVTGILASLTKVDMVDIRRYIVLSPGELFVTVGNTMLFVNTGPPGRIGANLSRLWQSVLRTKKNINKRYKWRVEVGHRKTLPWLVDWVVHRNDSAIF